MEIGERPSLAIGNRNKGSVGKFANRVTEIFEIKAAVQRCQMGPARASDDRQMNPVDMAVNDVELSGVLGKIFQEHGMGRERVRPGAAQTGGSGPDWNELCR